MTSDDEASRVRWRRALTTQKIYAWISIVSETRSSHEVSAFVGLQPDRAWKIGDRRGQTQIIEKNHGWVLNARLENERFDVEAHVDDVLQRVKRVLEKIALLPEEDIVTVHVATYSESRVLMSFDPHIPRLISALRARFDVETYFMPSQEHQARGD